MAYRPAGPSNKGIFAKGADSHGALSLPKNTGDTGDTGDDIAPVDRIIDDSVVAVLIDSDIGPLWFAFSDKWRPDRGDDAPVFFASELPYLRRMSADELRRTYEQRRAIGGWIRDRKPLS